MTEDASTRNHRQAMATTTTSEEAAAGSAQSQSQSRFYTRNELELFNVLKHPVWVFDIERKAMWWANEAALVLWNAETLQSLLERDFAHDMSDTTSKRLTECLRRYEKGETLSETWTFYPNGGGPVTTYLTNSGILVVDDDEQRDKDATTATTTATTPPPRLAMLCEGDMPSTKEEIDTAALRGVEMLRHLPVPVSQFDKQGNVMYQNPEASDVFCSNQTETMLQQERAEKERQQQQQQQTQENNGAEEQNENENVAPPSPPMIQQQVDSGCDFLNRFVDQDLGKRILQSVMQNGQDYMDEALQHTTNGPRWFAIQVRRSKDPVTGEPSLLCSARDLTELKELDRASTAKSEFVAVMAHEIRTPCHQVMGFMELLGETNLTSQQAELVDLLENSAMSLTAVVNDILDYSKLEAGRMKLECILFPTRNVILGSMDVIRNKALAKNLILQHHDFPLCIPENIIGDPNRIRQLLLNLLQNAVKFTPPNGTIALSVTRIDDIDDNSNKVVDCSSSRVHDCCEKKNPQEVRLRFEVTDSGIGISKSHMKHIFNKYQQADSSIARNYGGTGLGLSICKRLVEAMDGSIGVESELDKGSTFWMEIPFELPPPPPRRNNKHGRNGQHVSSGTTTNRPMDNNNDPEAAETIRSIHILVVEDNKANQKLVRNMLERLGHRVTIAENGAIALDAVEQQEDSQNKYDLVLMDIQMPVMDGFEATRELRARGWTPEELPVVGLTADYQPSQHQTYLDVGMNDCLGKPIRMKELRTYLFKSSLF